MQTFYGLAFCFRSQGNGNLLFNYEYPYSSIIYAGIVECRTLNFFQAIICKLAILGVFYNTLFLLMQWVFNSVFCFPFKLRKQPPDVPCKKGVRKMFVKFTARHLRRIVFYAYGLQPYQNRDYSTGVFLWILQNF